MANFRVGRVSQEILREVNDILSKKVRDPRVQEITITEVEVTGDLQIATIYYTTLQKLARSSALVKRSAVTCTGFFIHYLLHFLKKRGEEVNLLPIKFRNLLLFFFIATLKESLFKFRVA